MHNSSNSPPDSLVRFIAGIAAIAQRAPAAHAPAVIYRIPRRLRALARGVLRSTPLAGDDEAAEDLAADLMLRLVEVTRAGQEGSAVHLAGLGEEPLAQLLAHRLRQLAAERSERGKLVKELRAHVARALRAVDDDDHDKQRARATADPADAADIAAPAAIPWAPTRLVEDGCIRAALVGDAVRWILASEDAPARSVAAVARALMARYFPPLVRGEDAAAWANLAAGGDPEADIVRELDAERLARRVQRGLGHELTGVLAARLRGEPLRTLGKVATAHAKVKRAESAAARCLRHQSPATALRVLEKLREAGPGPSRLASALAAAA